MAQNPKVTIDLAKFNAIAGEVAVKMATESLHSEEKERDSDDMFYAFAVTMLTAKFTAMLGKEIFKNKEEGDE